MNSVPPVTQRCELREGASFSGGSFLRPDAQHDVSLIIMSPGDPGVFL